MPRLSLVCLLFSATPSLFAAPDRVAFAGEARSIEGVPVEAMELADPGLQIELWARSPMLYSPVAMDVDARGRLWLTEGIDYNTRAKVDAGQSIIVLEDRDGDGQADSSHVFVTEKGLRPAPLGIAVFDNRIVLSATPSILVYTDVDRDGVFDPKVDTREVWLTGFKNPPHDHTLHAVVGAPSGQWHFSYGNCGADLRTRDGRRIVSGSYYGHAEAIGQASSDGHTYVGGLSLRAHPDGTGLSVTGSNMRNPHDLFVTSHGDILQSDNDDPAHARLSWVMEYGNMGYADLRNGERSWEEVAKTWEEPSGWRRDLRFSRSHWRENYPGACPPGTIYGAGSPTGNVFIEDDALGLRGAYLVACMVRKEVMLCRPRLEDARVEMGPPRPFLRLKEGEKGQHFLPTDLALGPDGSLFLADFYNSTSRHTAQVSGSIYRITRRGQTKADRPQVDFTTVPGLVAALANPAVNVRSHAAAELVKRGESARPAVLSFLTAHGADAFLRSRAVWVLAQLGEAGRSEVARRFLGHADPEAVLVAYRALRHADPEGLLARAAVLARSASPAVRREVALSLRDVPYPACGEILAALIAGYDGRDRHYLEALGIACTGKEAEAYRDRVAPTLGDPARWSRRGKNLAWRLHTPEAIRDLDVCLRAQTPPVDEFRHLAMAFASYRSPEDRADRRARLLALAELPAFAAEHYQITVREIVEKDLNDLVGERPTVASIVPVSFGPPSTVSAPEIIAALPGDAARGRLAAGTCYLCHRLEGAGVAFGPELTHWGQQRTVEQIVREIVLPDAHLAHGYDTPARVTVGGVVLEGLLSNYSWHAGSLKLKLMGGESRKILFRQHRAKVENLKESWMPTPGELGLSDQNVRDIAEFLKTLGDGAETVPVSRPATAAPPRGDEPGWRVLDGDDFVNVNCHADTWRWENGHAYCTGKPTGVIRLREPLVNFEFLCEWMHQQKGGNSGVFVWATPASLERLAAGHGRLPHGIEVQVLDLGYAEIYTRQHKKPADWFTSHGDVFPVGPVKMRPFPPVAPDGRRSFPSAETTKGVGEWNHYYVRAVDGEVRLWVNGVEVSGGDGIEPASGYLCLESEGAPIEFRNLRLRELPAAAKPPVAVQPPPAPAAVSLAGHPALGRWYYGEHSREVTPEGFVTLRQGENIIWERRCVSRSDTGFVLEGDLRHDLRGEVLAIEGRYEARRRSPPP
jgi:putative membrane-bound dehydrogenase-like protein